MTDPAEILRMEHGVWQAVISKDELALAEAFSDDYVEVTIDGKRFSKESIVENSPQVDDVESYQIEEALVLDAGTEVAILSYQLTLHGQLRGKPIEPADRKVVSIWRHRDDRWQCCFFQQTAITHV